MLHSMVTMSIWSVCPVRACQPLVVRILPPDTADQARQDHTGMAPAGGGPECVRSVYPARRIQRAQERQHPPRTGATLVFRPEGREGKPGVSLPGADVPPIEAESYRIMRSRIDLTFLPPVTRAVTERVIYVSADFDYATDLVCEEETLAAAVAALAGGAPVVADCAMVAVGITSGAVICKMDDSLTARLARVTGITRAAAAVRLAFSETGPGAVWVVGCDVTAIEEIMRRDTRPALVIGMPAGFVGVAEAKQALRGSGLPVLTNVSEKGGAAVAAAAADALLGCMPAGGTGTGERH